MRRTFPLWPDPPTSASAASTIRGARSRRTSSPPKLGDHTSPKPSFSTNGVDPTFSFVTTMADAASMIETELLPRFGIQTRPRLSTTPSTGSAPTLTTSATRLVAGSIRRATSSLMLPTHT